MDFNRAWTVFALEAEYDSFGMNRIALAHNRLRARVQELESDNKKLHDLALKEIKAGLELKDWQRQALLFLGWCNSAVGSNWKKSEVEMLRKLISEAEDR